MAMPLKPRDEVCQGEGCCSFLCSPAEIYKYVIEIVQFVGGVGLFFVLN